VLLDDTAHPEPDLIVRMYQRRDLRNRMMTSAQVYPRRAIDVSTGASPQLLADVHQPILIGSITFTKRSAQVALICGRQRVLICRRQCRPVPDGVEPYRVSVSFGLITHDSFL
jgi:hypothetical protein